MLALVIVTRETSVGWNMHVINIMKRVKPDKFRLVYVFAATGIIVLISLVTIKWQTGLLDIELRDALRYRVEGIARGLCSESMERISFTAEDINNPVYQQLREQITAFHPFSHSRGIYTMALRDGFIFFGPESYSDDDPYASAPGTI